MASTLKVGDAVRLHNGVTVVLSEVDTSQDITRVFNLEVANLHNFFVGDSGLLVHNSGARPPNLSPPGSGRRGAHREAKRRSGVPVSQQPTRVSPNKDKRGNKQPGRSYKYEIPQSGGGTKKVTIRDDAAGHDFGDGDPQNRGPHFNDDAGNHYDYCRKR